MNRLINENDIIQVLNTMDRYAVKNNIVCEENNEEYPPNEMFIVDDIYEAIESIPTENNGEYEYNELTREWYRVD